MKILLDPIVTAAVRRCSTSVNMRVLVDHVLKVTDDVYFIWLVPDSIEDEDWEWLPKDDRIRYVQRALYPPCRNRDYTLLTPELENQYKFSADAWDYDMVITSRSQNIALLKRMTSKFPPCWRYFFVPDSMPMFSYKKHAVMAQGDILAHNTLANYLAADKVLFGGLWQKKVIMKYARTQLSMAALKRLDGILVDALNYQNEQIKVKTPGQIAEIVSKELPFTITLSRRLRADTDVQGIMNAMAKNFALAGSVEGVQCVITSPTKNHRMTIPEFIDLKVADQKEFWHIVRNEAAVGIFIGEVKDYCRSLIEPILRGLPVIVGGENVESMLGDDYPFYVKNAKEAAIVAREFQLNYEQMYQKFADWSEKFNPILAEQSEHWAGYHLDQAIAETRIRIVEHLLHTTPIGKAVEDHVNANDINEFDYDQVLGWKLPALKDFKLECTLDGMAWPWLPDMHKNLKQYMRGKGWDDAGPKLGHMRRKT